MEKKRATRTKTAQAEKKAVAVIDSTPNEYTSIELMNELKEYIKENNGCSFYQILISNNTYTYFPKLYAFTLDVEHYDFGTLKADTSQAKIKNELCNRYGAVHTFDLLTLHEIEAMAGAYGSFCKDARTKGFFDYVFAYAANKSTINCMTYNHGSKSFQSISRNKCKNNATLLPIHRLFQENKGSFSNKSVDEVYNAFVENEIIPKDLADNVKQALSQKYSLNAKKEISEEIMTNGESTVKKVDLLEISNLKLSEETTRFSYSSDLEKELLECDYKRFGFIKYEKDRLYDPQLGHWDLWDSTCNDVKMISRDPKSDVHLEYTAAIDFCTSSTVVVIQGETEKKIPLRIGTSDLFSTVDDKQFENPTYMQFVDFKSFKQHFDAKKGRPDTCFNDLPVSYNAKNSMRDNIGVSDSFYTFFSEIKQWADGKIKRPILFDAQGIDIEINEFKNTEDDDINPLVYYAYYIGLNINNMSRGICLDYLLSYPVTYEKKVCEKIRKAFEIGIMKSLPAAVLEGEELMKLFRVSLTASEPASYACCALQEYNIEPAGNQKILYGVFDFGGGTSDYDYGIFEEDEISERYDYTLTRFQSVGDRYLGGENILESLAYEVYLSNFSVFSKKRIPFKKPEFEKNTLLNEVLISENASVSAKVNAYVLKEKMRPIWEGTYSTADSSSNGNEEIYEINDASFYDIEGNNVNTIKLSIDVTKYRELIRGRIRLGVEHFFVGLENAINNLPKGYSLDNFKKIHVFLAGNSSRSPIVQEEFERYITQMGENKNINNASSFYYILPPLGTKEADEIIYGEAVPDEYDYRPNCKTGVAFGLLEFRHGGNIRFVNEQIGESDSHIKFKYFVGRKKKKEMIPLLNPNNAYNDWQPVITADLPDVDLYYTDKVVLDGSSISISDAKRFPIRISETNPQKKIYIRAVSSDSIEYVVASESEINQVTSGVTINLK